MYGFWSEEGRMNEQEMNIPQERYDAMSQKAVKVIGRERILSMSPAQRGHLNEALSEVLERHKGDVSSVTSDEIWGQFELITEYVLPTQTHEHTMWGETAEVVTFADKRKLYGFVRNFNTVNKN